MRVKNFPRKSHRTVLNSSNRSLHFSYFSLSFSLSPFSLYHFLSRSLPSLLPHFLIEPRRSKLIVDVHGIVDTIFNMHEMKTRSLVRGLIRDDGCPCRDSGEGEVLAIEAIKCVIIRNRRWARATPPQIHSEGDRKANHCRASHRAVSPACQPSLKTTPCHGMIASTSAFTSCDPVRAVERGYARIHLPFEKSIRLLIATAILLSSRRRKRDTIFRGISSNSILCV